MKTFQKPTKIRSPKIRKSAKGKPCTLRIADRCASRDTVVFCHAPSPHKGVSTKSDDHWGAYGCYFCHLKADRGQIEDADWLRAICETQKILFTENLIQIT